MKSASLVTERYFLIGFMGAGKTTLGRRVAERMGLTFIDLDEQIESSSGLSVAEIFAREGEAGFRRRETQALRDVVSDREPAVIATGGGAFTVDVNRSLMKSAGVVIWLDVPLAEIESRVATSSRPLLKKVTTPEELSELHDRRRTSYQHAHHHLLLANTRPLEGVERLYELLLRCRNLS